MEHNHEPYHNTKIITNKKIMTDKIHFGLIVLFLLVYILGTLIKTGSISSFAFICLSIIMLFSDISQLTYSFLFFAPMYLYMVLGTFPLYNVIIVALFMKRLLDKRTKINMLHIILFISLIIIEFFNILLMGTTISFNIIKLFMIIFIASLHFYNFPIDFSIKTGANYLFYGTFIYGGLFLFESRNFIFSNSYRIGGLGELDPNTYALYNLLAISVFIQQFMLGRYNRKQSIFMSIASLVILGAGFLTLSKTFLIFNFILLILIMIGSHKKPKHLFKLLLVLSIFFIIIIKLPLFTDSINSIVARIEMGRTGGDLTTGRTDIFRSYLQYIFSNVRTFFFGDGMYSYMPMLKIRPHNSLLELIISWGIIGTIIFISIFGFGAHFYKIKHKKNYNFKFYKLIPIIILFLYSQSLTLLYQEATYAYIIITLMLAIEVEGDKRKFRRLT